MSESKDPGIRFQQEYGGSPAPKDQRALNDLVNDRSPKGILIASLLELGYASRIIQIALNTLPPLAKPEFFAQIKAAGLDGDGITRRHERDKAFDEAMVVINNFPAMGLMVHLHRQRDWSQKTFGPGDRTAGVLDHLRKELLEVEAAPGDVSEWIDVAILAFDGAMRAGHSPAAVAAALLAKQERNEARTWPDWRTRPVDQAIEHDRSGEVAEVAHGN